MPTTILLMAFGVVSSAQDDVATLLENAQSLKLEYWRFTTGDTVSYWNVEFSGDEIRGLEKLINRAKLRVGGRVFLFMNSWDGEFSTSKQSFTIRIGDEKVATCPVVFVLTDKKTKAKQVFELLDEDARYFNEVLNRALTDKTKNAKPDRVRKR